jgi:hypothetical protein
LFSLPRGNEMFHFPRFPSSALCVQAPMTRHDPCRVFPFGDPRIKACLAAPRGLSQPATSFIGFQRQGIHRVPFATCRDDARARYGVHKDQPPRSSRLPAPTGPRLAGGPEGRVVRVARRGASAPAGDASASLKAAQCARTVSSPTHVVMTAERPPHCELERRRPNSQ